MKTARKTITLSDGSKLTVRKLSAMDYIKAGVKTLPNLVGDGTEPKQGGEISQKEEQARLEFYEITMRAIAACGLRIIGQDGNKTALVYKPLDEVKDGEITMEELPEEDITKIAEAVASFSGEVGQKAIPFPVEAGQSGQPAQSG